MGILTAAFMTEDSIRGLVKELKLPKELVTLAMDSVLKRKDDLYGKVAQEMTNLLNKVDLKGELMKLLDEHDVHIQAKLSFTRKTDKEELHERSKEKGD